jgi:hypothetical protein
MGSSPDGEDLLDPRNMDGPSVNFTVNDLLRSKPRLFIAYHVTVTPFALSSPFGALVGGALYGFGRMRKFPSVHAAMGVTSLAAGCLGSAIGLAGLGYAASRGPNATPTPWNEVGIQQRVDGLSHNFMVRVIDLSAWAGMGLAAGTMLLAGGPSKLKLSPGSLGIVQGLGLGVALGALGSMVCVSQTVARKIKDDDEYE